MAHDYVNPRSFMPGFSRNQRSLAREYRQEWQKTRPRVSATALVRGGRTAALAHRDAMRAQRATLFDKYVGRGATARPVTPRRYERPGGYPVPARPETAGVPGDARSRAAGRRAMQLSAFMARTNTRSR